MAQLHVFHFGPLDVETDSLHLLAAVGDVALAPVEHDTLEGAAAAMAKALPAGATVACDLSLARVARTHQWTPTVAPRLSRARLGLAFTVGQGLAVHDPEDFDAIDRLLAAVADYHRAKPWLKVDSEVALALRTTGVKRSWAELSVLGGAGLEYGLALYERPGSVARMAGSGLPPDTLAVLLEEPDDAPWLADAMAAVTGANIAPTLLCHRGGVSRDPRQEDYRLLTAALRAVVEVARGARPGVGRDVQPGRTDVEVEVSGRLALQAAPARQSDVPKVGRNEPCPCGSGLKYKKCHGGGRADAPSEGHRHADPEPAARADGSSTLHDLDRRANLRLLEATPRRLRDEVASALSRPDLVEHAVLHHLHFEGKTLRQWALDDAAAGLEADERAWLLRQQDAWFSLWEVEAVSSDGRLALHDLLTGERRVVHDVALAGDAKPRWVLLLRPVTDGASTIACGTHPQPLLPRDARRVVESFCSKMRRKRWRPAELAEPGPCSALFAAWGAELERLDRRGQARLRNTDGEELLFTTDRFRFDAARRAQVLSALAGLEGARPEPHRDGVDFVALVRPGNAVNPGWRATVVGALTVRADLLEAESNSLARADALRPRLEAALKGLARFEARTHADPLARLPEAPADLLVDAQAIDGSAVELALEVEQENGWLASPIEALGGKTPLEAVTTAKLRPAVHELLCGLEATGAGESRGASHGARFRRALGLSSRGEWIKPDEVWLGLGQGRKMSDTLLAFAAPMLGGSPDTIEPKLKLAVAVWNEVTAGGPGLGGGVQAALEGVGKGIGRALRGEVEWLARRKRALFSTDLRSILALEVTPRESGTSLNTAWEVTGALQRHLRRLGWRQGEAVLDAWSPAAAPAEFGWLAMPPAHRLELVLDHHRRTRASFGDDLFEHARLHVAVEDRVIGRDAGACHALDELRSRGVPRHEAIHTVGQTLRL